MCSCVSTVVLNSPGGFRPAALCLQEQYYQSIVRREIRLYPRPVLLSSRTAG